MGHLLRSNQTDRVIQPLGRANHLIQISLAVMQPQRIGEAMLAQIRVRIRIVRAFEQRQAQRGTGGVIAVLAVAQNGRAEGRFAQVDPAMHTGLEPGSVPTGVAVRRAFHMAELDFSACRVNIQVHREVRLEERLSLMPVDKGVELDLVLALPQRDHLHDARVSIATFDPKRGPQRAVLNDRDACGAVAQCPELFFVIVVDIPAVVGLGFVLIGDKPVRGVTRRNQLAFSGLVIDRGDLARGVEADDQTIVFQPLKAGRRAARCSLGRRNQRGGGPAHRRKRAGGGDVRTAAVSVFNALKRRGAVTDLQGQTALHRRGKAHHIAVAVLTRKIDQRQRAGGPASPRKRCRDQAGAAVQFGRNPRVVRVAIGIDRRDRGAGQDVVELVDQGQVPQLLQLRSRIVRAGGQRCHAGGKLGLA